MSEGIYRIFDSIWWVIKLILETIDKNKKSFQYKRNFYLSR